MVSNHTSGRRAQSNEELEPLVSLCKTGRLFDVQKWVEAGRPLDPPPSTSNRTRKKSPLEYALDLGFHSMVEVLLEGGASLRPDNTFCPMELALSKRRFDLVQLLVDHGFAADTANMDSVFATWDPEIMEYFIERGADVETDMPLGIGAVQSRSDCPGNVPQIPRAFCHFSGTGKRRVEAPLQGRQSEVGVVDALGRRRPIGSR